MKVSSMIGEWFRISQAAVSGTFAFAGELADSLFTDYTIEENLLLLKEGRIDDKNQPVCRRISASEKTAGRRSRNVDRDGLYKVPNECYGFGASDRPSDEAR